MDFEQIIQRLLNDQIIQLRILSAVFVSLGFYALFLELFDLPNRKTRKRLAYLQKQANTKPSVYNRLIDKVAKLFIPFIKIDELKYLRLKNELTTLEINLTPEQYYANAIAKGVVIGIFCIPGFFLHIAIGIIFLILGIFIFLLAFNEVDKVLKKRRDQIDTELPRFVAVIKETFRNDRDVIKLIDTYVTNSDTSLAKELRVVSADMKTGDFEIALTRLSTRVDSVFLTELVRGLISTVRGDNTVAYFESLNSKLWDHERARIKKAAMKTPAKVKYLCMALMVGMGIIYAVVFGTVIMEGMGGILGQM